MDIVTRIREDLNAARRARSPSVPLIAALAGEVERVGKDAGGRVTTDAEAVTVLRRFVKNASETLAACERQGRDVAPVKAEIELFSRYLPVAVRPEAVEEEVRSMLPGLPAGPAAMGAVMKRLKEKYGESFDGAVMSPVAKKVLDSRG